MRGSGEFNNRATLYICMKRETVEDENEIYCIDYVLSYIELCGIVY